MKTLRELKQGEYFTLSPIADPNEYRVWVRGEYNRSTHKFECHRFDDICHIIERRGDLKVYTDFTF